MSDLHLASSSLRRIHILKALGLRFSSSPVAIDETRQAGESAQDMVLRLAAAKAQAAGRDESTMVIGADTVVVLDSDVFGKPVDREHALCMLSALSGRTHRVLTGVALCHRAGVRTRVSNTEVRFRELGPDEADAYWQSGEPAGKAGAYAIQGLGAIFVTSITGSYSGVVGLPVFETCCLLREAGFDMLQHTMEPE